MKRYRVLHFELDENLGGIETFLLNLLKQIDRDKIQFEFVTAVEKPAMEHEYLELGAVIHHVSHHSDLLHYCRDVARLLESDFDVVHIHKNSAANIIPLILANRAKVKKIFIHSHNTAPSIGGVSNVLHMINKPYLNKIADRRFACSSVAGKWMFGDRNFELLKNGIITKQFLFTEEYRDKKRSELGIGENEFVVGNIGRFTKQKNQIRAVSIFEKIKNKMPEAKLIFIGEGEFLSEVMDSVKQKKLEKDVLFLGLRRDIPELLMAMDVFLMPSLYEGLPIVAIEAQSTGLSMVLADTISPETEISDAIKWFSLGDDDDQIADIVLSNTVRDFQKRLIRNKQVSDYGYDMLSTAKKLEGYYLE